MSRKFINNKTLINKQYIFNDIIEQTEMQIICAKFHKIMLTILAAISNKQLVIRCQVLLNLSLHMFSLI